MKFSRRIKPTKIHLPQELYNSPFNIVSEKFEIPHISVIQPKKDEIITVANVTIKGSDVVPMLHETIDLDLVSATASSSFLHLSNLFRIQLMFLKPLQITQTNLKTLLNRIVFCTTMQSKLRKITLKKKCARWRTKTADLNAKLTTSFMAQFIGCS